MQEKINSILRTAYLQCN